MNVQQAQARISELKDAISLYTHMVNGCSSIFTKGHVLKTFIIQHKKEIARLESLIYLKELEGDSNE